MKDRDKGMMHFFAIEVLIVIVVLTAQGVLQTGIGIVLSMFSFGSLVWLAIIENKGDET